MNLHEAISYDMKSKILFYALFLTILISLLVQCSEKKPNNKIVGEWTTSDKKLTVIFYETKHAIFIKDNMVLGGDEYSLENGKKAEVNYEMNEAVNPATLDIIVREKGNPKENGRIVGIFRYLTENKIEWRMSFDGKRFKEFNHKDKDFTALLNSVVTK